MYRQIYGKPARHLYACAQISGGRLADSRIEEINWKIYYFSLLMRPKTDKTRVEWKLYFTEKGLLRGAKV